MTTKDASIMASMISTLAALAGCSTVPPVGQPGNLLAGQAEPDRIRWPEAYAPEQATFFVHNQIEIAAPPDAVWHELIRAEDWPSWYPGASNVEVLEADDGLLAAGRSFRWRTMDLDFTSTVTEFDPPRRLSWESRKPAIQGYHAWLLVPTPEGTRLITDEAQHGPLARLQGIFIPNKLRRLHDVWLAEIKARAESRASHPTPRLP